MELKAYTHTTIPMAILAMGQFFRDDINKDKIGFMSNGRNDFQNQKLVYLINKKEQMPTPRGWWVTPHNFIVISIFLAVRHSIEATWLNDRDQFYIQTRDGRAT